MTATAEFNVFVDPEAADVVFRSGIPIKMFGLNVTRQVYLEADDVERIRALGSRAAVVLADLLSNYLRLVRRKFGAARGALHDPCAALGVIDPSLFEMHSMPVAVELNGRLTRGMTVCDRRQVGPADRGEDQGGVGDVRAEVAIAVDRTRALKLILGALS